MCCERGVTCDRASLLRRTLSLPLRRKGASSSRAARARGRKKEGRKEGRKESVVTRCAHFDNRQMKRASLSLLWHRRRCEHEDEEE